MKSDHAAILRDQYEQFWTEQLATLPDGWGHLLVEFFDRLDKLNNFHARDRRSAWVKLDFRLYPGGGGMDIKATPLHSPDIAWTRPQREHLAQTLEWMNTEIQKVCEVCGSPSETLFKTEMGEGRDRLLCSHHLAENRARFFKREIGTFLSSGCFIPKVLMSGYSEEAKRYNSENNTGPAKMAVIIDLDHIERQVQERWPSEAQPA